MNKKWNYVPFCQAVEVCDTQRKPINSKERSARIAGKELSELYPYYGATGQVGHIDGYITDGEYVLLGEDGAPFLNTFARKAYIISGKAWVNNPAHVLRSKTNNKFLCYYLNCFNYKGYVSGTTRLKLTQAQMQRILVPVPDIEEQKRIVAKIEELFSELDNGVETLKKTKQQLAVYRQAVFNSVIDSYPGEKFVLSEIAKTIDGDRGKNYPKREEFSNEGFCLFLTAQNVRPYGWRFDDNSFITKGKDEILNNGKLQLNDIVLTTRGTLGNVAVYDATVPYENVRINSCMLIIRANTEKVSPYYLASFLMSPLFKFQVEKLKSGTAQPQIPANILKNTVISVPTLEEQEQIVSELNSRFSVCDSIEQTVDAALQQAEAMRQSILKKAFEAAL